MNSPVFLKGKKVGEINLEQSYYISYRNDTHVFHLFGDGFGLSESLINILEENKIKKILINFKDKELYHSTLQRFLIFSKEYNDNGDKQLILPREHWLKQIPNYKQDKQERIEL